MLYSRCCHKTRFTLTRMQKPGYGYLTCQCCIILNEYETNKQTLKRRTKFDNGKFHCLLYKCITLQDYIQYGYYEHKQEDGE